MPEWLPEPVEEKAFGFKPLPPVFLELAAADLNEEATGLEDLTGTIQQAQEEAAAAVASLPERDAEIADSAEWTRLTFEDTDPLFDEHLAGVDEAAATLTDRVDRGIDDLENPPPVPQEPGLPDPAETERLTSSLVGVPGLEVFLDPLESGLEGLEGRVSELEGEAPAPGPAPEPGPVPEPVPEPEPAPDQLEEIRAQLAALTAVVGDLRLSIEDTNARLGTLETVVAGEQAALSDLATRVARLEAPTIITFP